MNKNAFFQYKEARALSGYGSALLVKLPYDNDDGKYSLLVASETTPYVFGDKEIISLMRVSNFIISISVE